MDDTEVMRKPPSGTRKPPNGQSNRVVGSAPKKPPSARKQAIEELFGLVQLPLATLAAHDTAKNPDAVSPYVLDLYTIEEHKSNISDAVVDLADNYPVLANVIDKVAVGAPFGALIMTMMVFGIQLAENHGLMPESAKGTVPGIIPKEEFEKQVREEAKKRQSNGADD